MKYLKRQQWLRLVLYLIVLVFLGAGLSYLLQLLLASFDIAGRGIATTVYLVVFVTSLVCNAGIIIPVAVHTSVMIAAASQWDPVLLALVASVGGALGEITGYYAGYFGKKIVLAESIPWYSSFVGWMKRNGPWAIWVISFQPVFPVDIAGITAGISRLPLWKFLLPCWAGKFPKYLIFCYFGSALFQFLPSWF